MGMKRKLAGLALLAAAGVVFPACGFAATSIPSSSAVPATIIFTANNPTSNPTDSGSSAATISFTTTGGANARTWSVQVRATSANFGSCPSTVPVTQVTVSCGSATVSGGGGSGSCGGSFNLSNALQTVASGSEGTGANRAYMVTLSFTFTDSWAYLPQASACTLPLSYTITAN